MKYKLIGIRPNHKQMREIKLLYRINFDKVEKVYVLGLRINELNKWEFILTGETDFRPNEPLFINIKSVKRYAKKNCIELAKIEY